MSVTTGEIDVLHVDDDADFASVVATWLERENQSLSVTTATSAADGLAAIDAESPDCVVSDYEMPGKTGIEFLADVRAAHPDLPFILFTGKGSEEIASEAISAGVTDYLQKEAGTDQYAILANRIENSVGQYVAERAVEQSQERLRRVLDSLPHSVFVVDEDLTYLLSNEVHAGFHDLSVAAMEGTPASDVLEPAHYERFAEDVGAVIETGDAGFFPEVELRGPDGEPRRYDSRLVPFDLAGTDEETVLCVGVDVTEQRRRQRRLEHTHEWLQEFVATVDRELRESVETGLDGLATVRTDCESDAIDVVDGACDRVVDVADAVASLTDRAGAVTNLEPVELRTAARRASADADTRGATVTIESTRTLVADAAALERLLGDLFEARWQDGKRDSPESATVTVGDLPDGFFVEDDRPDGRVTDSAFGLRDGDASRNGAASLGLAGVSLLAAAHGWDVALTEGRDGGTRVEFHGVEAG